MKTLTIVPVNEPHGQGNGWDVCTEAEATGFEIDNGKTVVEFFDTLEKAQAYVAAH